MLTKNEFTRIRRLTSSLLPWVKKRKTDKIWLCESIGQLKGIGSQGEAKMNEMNIHTISYLQRYVRSYGLPKQPIRGFGQIYEHGLEALPGKTTPSIKDHRKAKNKYFLRYGERWVEKLKSSSYLSKILMYHWYDPVCDEGSRGTDEIVCEWGRYLYRP